MYYIGGYYAVIDNQGLFLGRDEGGSRMEF